LTDGPRLGQPSGGVLCDPSLFGRPGYAINVFALLSFAGNGTRSRSLLLPLKGEGASVGVRSLSRGDRRSLRARLRTSAARSPGTPVGVDLARVARIRGDGDGDGWHPGRLGCPCCQWARFGDRGDGERDRRVALRRRPDQLRPRRANSAATRGRELLPARPLRCRGGDPGARDRAPRRDDVAGDRSIAGHASDLPMAWARQDPPGRTPELARDRWRGPSEPDLRLPRKRRTR